MADNWFSVMASGNVVDYNNWNSMVSYIQTGHYSGSNNWNSHNYHNSGLCWDDSLKKFKSMKSGGGSGDLTQATANGLYKASTGTWKFASSQNISGGNVRTNNITFDNNLVLNEINTINGDITRGFRLRNSINSSYIYGNDEYNSQLYIQPSDKSPYPYLLYWGSGSIDFNTGGSSREIRFISGNVVKWTFDTRTTKVSPSISTQNISGALLAINKSRDINNFDSSNWNNSGLMWDSTIGKWKAHKSGASTGGASTFTSLTDAPNSYVGKMGKTPIVNVAENALVFAEIVCVDNQIVFNSNQVVWA